MSGSAYHNQKPIYNNPACEQQKQVQILKLNQKQQQEEQLIRYYIFENLQYFINLIYSLKAVNEHFQNDPQHPMKIIARNKIVLQSNLSNSIQYDQQYQYKSDSKLYQVLQQEKLNAKQLLEQLSPELKEEFQSYIDAYKTYSLNQNIQMCSQNLEQTNLQSKFDQKVLQSVINSISSVDQTTQQFKEQKIYNRPKMQDVILKAQNYYEKTKQQLDINFPNPINVEQESNQSLNSQAPKLKLKQKQKNSIGIKKKIYKDSINQHNKKS
ncbi:unnamed protein product [Paramecium primaurelia]|uniref:Uncharacterized protein n=1 Tax=Paramecium primaurelia TaxID=5886 RepID=A0A8S1NCR5_PARPR|nr:unnamed protein product [Paramecium primaurelia]